MIHKIMRFDVHTDLLAVEIEVWEGFDAKTKKTIVMTGDDIAHYIATKGGACEREDREGFTEIRKTSGDTGCSRPQDEQEPMEGVFEGMAQNPEE